MRKVITLGFGGTNLGVLDAEGVAPSGGHLHGREVLLGHLAVG